MPKPCMCFGRYNRASGKVGPNDRILRYAFDRILSNCLHCCNDHDALDARYRIRGIIWRVINSIMPAGGACFDCIRVRRPLSLVVSSNIASSREIGPSIRGGRTPRYLMSPTLELAVGIDDQEV